MAEKADDGPQGLMRMLREGIDGVVEVRHGIDGGLADDGNLVELLVQLLDATGELKAQYRPGAMVASFMLDPDDPAVLRRESIPVPKGPVDTW